jgi:trigger factor
MKVQMESPSACRRILRVEVDSGVVDAEYDKVALEYAGEASVPGFRKGKAPVQLVRQRFSKGITEETSNRLIPQYYREALKSQNLLPVAVIEVRDVVVKNGEPLTFCITVDVPPQFELPKYKGISLSGKKVEATDEQVDKAIEGLRTRAAKYEAVTDKPVEAGHLVQIDYSGTCGGVAIETIASKAAQVGSGKGAWIMAGESGFIPGLCEGIVGASVGDTRSVSVTFPADFRVDVLADKQADYVVVVKAVSRQILPPVDAEFLKQVGVESVEKLRDEIRSGMLRQGEEIEKSRLKNELAKELLARSPMDVPQSLVAEESRKIIQDIVSDSTRRGMSREEIVEQHESISSVAEKSSQDNIKLEYILDAIASEEKLTAEDNEVEQTLEAIAARHHTDKEKVRQDLDKRGSMERIRRSIRVDKALELVLSQAKISIA